MRRLDLYGGTTCLEMAIAADDKKFIHEDACQALLTNIWYDKVDPDRERTRLVANILTLGIWQLFISIYEKHFSEPVKTQTIDRITSAPPQRRLKKHGIDYTDDYGVDETTLQNFLHFHNRPIVKYCYTCNRDGLRLAIVVCSLGSVHRHRFKSWSQLGDDSKNEMIPIDDTIDYAWSEFERYSTNDYIRQLLDAQATVLANAMTTNMP
ncbi:unnamed protein product [Rotaria sp. Silwood2]|nr:unnamed protein product [Rotaria sp. Silwood2]CAF4024511.1 unnamed protein product [Rotaria sp. Silwood2]CAF4140236.1 unnamed protein product [Rotaria sp. Silwood2]CAF4145307.1 unnamed protein product [Rotaria sp. Silwood2]